MFLENKNVINQIFEKNNKISFDVISDIKAKAELKKENAIKLIIEKISVK